MRELSSWFLERELIGDRIRLCVGVTLVGRQAGSATTSSAIYIDSSYVSRKHAEIIVDKDDRIVLKDLNSINGTFINGTKIQNNDISLKANDCIGIGVTDDSEPNLKHPIYNLIYAPLPGAKTSALNPFASNLQSNKVPLVEKLTSFENPSNKETSKNTPVSVKEVIVLKEGAGGFNDTKQETTAASTSKTKSGLEVKKANIPIELPKSGVHNVSSNRADTITDASSPKKSATVFPGEIIVLSDDEDDDIYLIKKEVSMINEKNFKLEESQVSDQNISNVPDNVHLNLTSSNKELTSGKISENFTNSVVHEPILPEVKREFVRSCTQNVVDVFGRPDDLILETVKDINPLLHTTLKNQKENRTLYNGDKIDLSSENEDDDGNVDQNVECFGELVPVEESREIQKETHKNDENKAAINAEVKIKEKSPTLFENSLNSSNNSEDEHKNNNKNAKSSKANKEPEVTTEDPDIVTDELAEFVDMYDDMMFSQILINDLKSEMMAEKDEEFNGDCENHYEELRDEKKENIPLMQIKKESIDNQLVNPVETLEKQYKRSGEIENDIWIITDDDEYYDEELEHKVTDWSTKLLSQKINMSQVFELSNDEENDSEENEENKQEDNGLKYDCGSEDLDDFFNEALVDDVIATLAQKTGEASHVSKPASDVTKIKINNQSYNSRTSKELVESNASCSHFKPRRKSSGDSTDNAKEEGSTRTSKLLSHHEELASCHKTEATPKGKEERLGKMDIIKAVKRLHHPPSVIDAPSLPKHKGKHRGVSAETRSPATSTTNIRKKSTTISAQLKDERYREELKKKWFEKPTDEKKREREKNRQIKESRKERLKELADKQAVESSKNILKRRHTPERETNEKKKAKVKITSMNRGALLAEDIGATKKKVNNYKIPKTKRPSSDSAKPQNHESSTNATSLTCKPNSATLVDAFAEEMNKVDKINNRRFSNNFTSRMPSRSSSTEDSKNEKQTSEKRVLNAPARRTSKITFASMQKNFIESRKNQQLLENLANNRSCLIDVKHRNADKERKKKHVRFNETPIIYYIERINGANKRVDRKDILPKPTCSDRAHMVRLSFAMVDKTAQIISEILGWSNEWLVNRNAKVDAASDIVLPMPNQFSSFNHYKSIIIPLMKLEFISVLEREKGKCKSNTFNVIADHVTPYMDRFIIMARSTSIKNSDTRSELVVLEWGKFSTFAYMSSKRIGVSTTTFVYEVLAKDLSLEELRANFTNSITVRPMIDIVRVEFGAFNAIYQLEQSPLLAEILDPMELFKLKPLPKCNVQYCGFDELNNRQKDVLINIYRRAIEPTPNIALIQGPPGTGKSCVIANLVHQLLYGNEVRILDQKVLICAQSNAAVDAIAEKLFNMSQKKLPDNMFRLIRFGMLDRISPRVRHATLPKIIERNQIRKLKMTCKNLQIDNNIDIKEYLRNEIVKLECDIEHMKHEIVKGTVQEEQLNEKHRQVQLMRNIVNGVLRPDDERSLYNWHLMHANVVCTTLSSCVKLSQYVNYFDICIIDEATQCTEPWTLMPLKFGIHTLVLVGDTQQLPATVLSKKASEYGLGTSLFTRIQRCIESVTLKSAANNLNDDKESSITNSNNVLFSLQTQYRMHPEICKWPNSYFYKNELIDDPKTHQLKTPLKPFSVLNLTYTQDNNCHRGQIVNELEAKFVARLVKTLDCYIPMKYNSFGVITPYAQQRGALEKALCAAGFTNVMVNTIDSYQGMERDVIIISNARTTGIGFLSNYQRLNVALTRPKKCLILCGNLKNLESVPVWRSLLASARDRQLYHELTADCMDDMHRNVIPKIKIFKATEQITTPKEVTTIVSTRNH